MSHCIEKITSYGRPKVVNANGEGRWTRNKWKKGKGKKLDLISLSASTMKRRTIDMSNDVLEQMVSQVNASPFDAMQLDESTDIAGLPQFLFLFDISIAGKC